MHILVVDPNEAFATLLSEELKRQGYDVDMCVQAGDALRVVREHRVDLAILDMALADPDAPALGQALRAVHPGMRIMLIPLMGEALSADAETLDVQGVLPKPFFLPDLPQLIEAALARPVGISSSATAATQPEARPQPAVPDAAAPPARRLRVRDDGFSPDAFAASRAQVERLLGDLVQDVGADTALLTFDGAMLASVGGLSAEDAESIARAIVQGWQTSVEVARILGREQVRFEQSITGGEYILYALTVESTAILGLVVRGTAPLGLLRHRARTVAEEIARLCVV